MERNLKCKHPEGQQVVKAVLLCGASDNLASREMGRFLGHSALKGWFRWLKSFPMEKFGEINDYSGFNRGMWPKRLIESLEWIGSMLMLCQTLKDSMVSFSQNFLDSHISIQSLYCCGSNAQCVTGNFKAHDYTVEIKWGAI